MGFAKHEKAEWIRVKQLIDTNRGIDGFGHKEKG
jgi:dUTPase